MTQEKNSGTSRRDFLKTLAAGTVAALAPTTGNAEAPQPNPVDSILFKKLGEPNKKGFLDVSHNHHIHWEEFGNPKGEPILLLHGGPGGGISRTHLRMMDPKHYRIIAFDQRGCGESTFGAKRITSKQVAEARIRGENIDDMVKAMLAGNTTENLVEDIVKLREHLGIDKPMNVFGGSWGSTLALGYAIKHPDTVKSMTLRGVDLGRKMDNDWYCQGNATNLNDTSKPGAYKQEPQCKQPEYIKAWKRYVEHIPTQERGNMFEAYRKRLNSDDLKVVNEASIRLGAWEEVTSRLQVGKPEEPTGNEAVRELPGSLLWFHYYGNNCFFPEDDYVLNHIDRIKHIPTIIVQGQHDAICPEFMADALVSKWREAQKDPKKWPEFHITNAGHSATELETAKKLVEATNEFARRDRLRLYPERTSEPKR